MIPENSNGGGGAGARLALSGRARVVSCAWVREKGRAATASTAARSNPVGRRIRLCEGLVATLRVSLAKAPLHYRTFVTDRQRPCNAPVAPARQKGPRTKS